jgi:hypothetical protein
MNQLRTDLVNEGRVSIRWDSRHARTGRPSSISSRGWSRSALTIQKLDAEPAYREVMRTSISRE